MPASFAIFYVKTVLLKIILRWCLLKSSMKLRIPISERNHMTSVYLRWTDYIMLKKVH